MTLQQKLQDNPASVSEMQRSCCNRVIGDHEYKVDAQGCPRHHKCPPLEDYLRELIADLTRCAKRNGSAAAVRWPCGYDAAQAGAVAAEQRRMIRKLKALVA